MIPFETYSRNDIATNLNRISENDLRTSETFSEARDFYNLVLIVLNDLKYFRMEIKKTQLQHLANLTSSEM